MPRSRVIKDDAVAEVAMQMPQSKEALGQLRALPRGMATSRIGDGLLRAVKEGLARDPATLPHTIGAATKVLNRSRPRRKF